MLTQMNRQVEEAARSIVENYDTFEEAEECFYEQAVYMVPVMNNEVIKEWEAIPNYDAEDYCGGYDIINQMQAAIMEWYVTELREWVEALYAEREDDDAF